MSIQVLLQTRLNPPKVIYDSAAGDTGAGDVVKNIVKPVIAVDVNGSTIYKTADFYPDYSPYILAGIAGVLFTVLWFIWLWRAGKS